MENDITRIPHYRCRHCGHCSPLSEIFCTRPSCHADLNLYGDVIQPAEPAPTPMPEPPAPVITYPEPAITYPEPVVNYPEPVIPYPQPEPMVTYPEPVMPYPQPEPVNPYPEPTVTYPEIIFYPPEPPTPEPPTPSALGFLKKRTLLIWLDVYIFLLYLLLPFTVLHLDIYVYGELMMGAFAGVMVLTLALSVYLVATMQFIAHGFLHFAVAIGSLLFYLFTELLWEFCYMPLLVAMTGISIWLGIFSFLHSRLPASRKAPGFLRKQAVLLNLEIWIFLLGVAGVFFQVNFDVQEASPHWLPSLLLLLMFCLNIFLLIKKQYTQHGLILLFVAVTWATMSLLLVTNMWTGILDGLLSLLMVFVGILSFIKER